MDDERRPSACDARTRPGVPLQRGAAIVEVVIALPILLAVILGAIQFGLIYQAKATLNHASLQAARAGAVENAEPEAIRGGLARALAPLYSPQSSLGGVINTVTRVHADLLTNARIRVLNPTREAFADFGEDVSGVREIPNDRLHTRSTTVGAQSGVNIQDANILRVQITYGYELKVPLVNWFITRTLLRIRGGRSVDAFEQQLLRRTLLPIVATATVRMQSPARLSDLVVARAALPEVERFDAAIRPPDEDEDEDESDSGEGDGESNDGEDGGSNLGDGFLGFGGGPADGSGAGPTPPDDGGGGSGSDAPGDGGNNGNPQQCPGGGGSNPFLPPQDPPGDFSPAIDLPNLAVGNPIHVVTGNKYQPEADIARLPGPLGIEFTRHYNSASATRTGAIGAGWRHSYEMQLHVPLRSGQSSAPSVLYLTQADGRELKFVRSGQAPRRYTAQRASDGELEIDRESYRWRRDSRDFVFDRDGRLRQVREHRHTLTLHYDPERRLARVVDPQQRTLQFTYYSNGRLAGVSAAHDATMRYSYDRHGNLEYAVSSAGAIRRYHYEDARHPNHLTGISVGSTKPQNYGERNDFERIATWGYDEQGRGVLSSHAGGASKTMLVYGDDYTDVADAFGRTSRYTWSRRDGIAFVTEVHGPGCSACGRGDVAYEFNDRFQLTQVVAKHAPALRYRYDEQYRLVEVDRETTGDWERLVRYSYSGGSRQPARIERASINPRGVHSIEIEYRSDWLPQQIRERGYTPTTNGGYAPIERRFRFDYNANGQLVSIDGPRSDARDITQFQYDSRGSPLATISADGLEQRILDRDKAGRPGRIRMSGLPDIQLRYDGAGRVAAITQARSTGERTVHYRYDVLGRLREIEQPDRRTRRIDYDSERSAIRSTDASGITQAVLLGADGQIAKRALLARPDNILSMLHFAYDARRRLIEVRDGDGPALQQLVYEDGDDLPDRAIDPLGAETQFDYDPLRRVAAITAADGGVMRFDYDNAGRTSQLTAPNYSKTRYEYDDFGRRVREHSADRGMAQYQYDAADNLIERIDGRGERVSFAYTPGNRIETVRAREGETKFSYLNGRLVHVEGPWGAEIFDYDADGNFVERTRRLGDHEFVAEYRYHASGRISRRRLVSGGWLTYEYNANGSVQRIVHHRRFSERTLLGGRKGAALDPLVHLPYGNGLTLRGRVGDRGRLNWRDTKSLDRLQYRYDEAGRLIRIDDAAAARSYDYDAMDRLIAARSPNGALSYTYDANGNRQTVVSLLPAPAARGSPGTSSPSAVQRGAGVEASYQYISGSNRLASVDGERRTAVLYDTAGNPTHIGNRTYEYNSHGRPTRLLINGRLIAEYAYNVWGERISKTLHSSGKSATTFYIYEQHRLAAEADEHGRVTREYVYLDHHPVAMLDHGVPYWIHTDHLGAPVAVTDENRTVVWRAEYEPFGLADVQEDPDGDGRLLTLNLRFPGQYADEESATYYNVMRDYDPTTGRYLTPDPLGSFDGPNPFAYVRGNPLSRIDPLGLYLFAFDGTWVNRTSGTLTNVELFRRYYDPSATERNSFYRRGLGAPDEGSSDFENSVDRVLGGFVGWGGRASIDEGLRRLDDLIAGREGEGLFDGVIDIVGFSRGAALARSFANEVFSRIDEGYYRDALELSGMCRSLRIRFMGLFDTVAAFGIPWNETNLGYDLRVDDRISTVVQAVALNEHRVAFDLASIQYSEHARNTTPYREERGFIGAHSDIGGGYETGDLSDIALRWMHQQAVAAGVRMSPLTEEHSEISAPILHDERNYLSQDREIFYPNDPNWRPARCPYPVAFCGGWDPPATQRQLTAPQFQFAELADMIRENRGPGAVRGTVDMDLYKTWLFGRGQW